MDTLMTGAAVAVALASLAVLLARRPRSEAELLFALVSGSMALSLMSPWFQPAPAGGARRLRVDGHDLMPRCVERGERRHRKGRCSHEGDTHCHFSRAA